MYCRGVRWQLMICSLCLCLCCLNLTLVFRFLPLSFLFFTLSPSLSLSLSISISLSLSLSLSLCGCVLVLRREKKRVGSCSPRLLKLYDPLQTRPVYQVLDSLSSFLLLLTPFFCCLFVIRHVLFLCHLFS